MLRIGELVHYVLSNQDVAETDRRRVYGAGHGPAWPAGAQAHVGNSGVGVSCVPALVVWPHNNADRTFNGQAFLDGNDVLWITSVPFAAKKDGWRSQSWHTISECCGDGAA